MILQLLPSSPSSSAVGSAPSSPACPRPGTTPPTAVDRGRYFMTRRCPVFPMSRSRAFLSRSPAGQIPPTVRIYPGVANDSPLRTARLTWGKSLIRLTQRQNRRIWPSRQAEVRRSVAPPLRAGPRCQNACRLPAAIPRAGGRSHHRSPYSQVKAEISLDYWAHGRPPCD